MFCPKYKVEQGESSNNGKKGLRKAKRYKYMKNSLVFFVLAMGGGFLVFKLQEKKTIEVYSQRLTTLSQNIEDYGVGVKGEEYKKSLDNYYALLEKKNIRELERKQAKLSEIEKEVENYSKEFAQLKEYQGAFDDLSKNYVLSEENERQLEELNRDLNTSIEKGDLEAGQLAVRDLKAFKKYIIEDNKKQIQLLKKKLEEMNLSRAYQAELEHLVYLKQQGEALFESGKYGDALRKFKKSKAVAELINSYIPYTLTINQVDASNYPTMKLYVTLKDDKDKKIEKELIPEAFYLSERLIGEKNYTTYRVEKVSLLKEREKLNIGLVLDVSEEIREEDLKNRQEVIKQLMSQVHFQEGDKVTLEGLEEKNYLEAIDQMMEMKEAKDSIYDTLYVAINQMAQQEGVKCIIAFSDGRERESKCTPQMLTELAKHYQIPIFIIDIGEEGAILQALANNTGGFYRSIKDTLVMQEIYDAVYKERQATHFLEYENQQTDNQTPREIYISYEEDKIKVRMLEHYILNNPKEESKSNNIVYTDKEN
ncbi:hypothetical protein CS063_07795 [Sporanaerobium hydrogeniformans]|uniref:Uncharacterized protein n=1 Tax=Sporanaerobium hydrogeniformans TaxID=3072179 RepID=A0AC61DDL0_9FIRM|nr:vWA domain-containing protein [Sporanaerobium hydrogeniformans]PHV70915.1 hypothetical protein CS063_07795 [Sporanaerobium hydrogeniformans]